MKKRELRNQKKRNKISIIAAALALLLLLTGSFAWFYTVNVVSELEGNGTVARDLENSAVLHDDFDQKGSEGAHNKDVYVENTGEDALFVRIRLDEYMEINGESLIAGADRADESTWKANALGESEFAEHWDWTTGGAAIQYMPNDFGKQGVTSRYDEDGNDTLEGVTEGLKWTHNGVATEVVTMEVYRELTIGEKENFTGWIIDIDGYAYWSEKLPSEEATGRFLNEVKLNDTISEEDEYFYAINVVLETVDEDDLDAWLNGTETADGQKPDKVGSGDAEELLKGISDR